MCEAIFESVSAMGSWPIILPVLGVGIVLGVLLRSRFFRRWFELNQILQSAESLGRHDRLSRR